VKEVRQPFVRMYWMRWTTVHCATHEAFLLAKYPNLDKRNGLELAGSSRFFGKPIRGIFRRPTHPSPFEQEFFEIDRRQGGDVTLRST